MPAAAASPAVAVRTLVSAAVAAGAWNVLGSQQRLTDRLHAGELSGKAGVGLLVMPACT